MAGGRGERMRASGVDVPKPLVAVRGVPLVEHNLRRLLACGFTEIAVSVPDDGQVRKFAEDRLAALATAAGATLKILAEATPLGNIGCAAMLRGEGNVLAVYADNLTALDLRQVAAHHEKSSAALTLAAHDERFRLPYGRLDVRDGRVVGYAEKPSIAVTVSSAVAVLGPPATEALSGNRPAGLVDLTMELLRRGLTVAAYRHAAPWVDVNTADDVRRAETLLEEHSAEFA
jgi:NDP-mannose synthase